MEKVPFDSDDFIRRMKLLEATTIEAAEASTLAEEEIWDYYDTGLDDLEDNPEE